MKSDAAEDAQVLYRSVDDLQPEKRCERIRLPITSSRRGKLGYVVKTVYKLIRYMHRRLNELVSTQRDRQFATKFLAIKIWYCKRSASLPASRRPSAKSLVRVHKATVPLSHPISKCVFLDFWHQLDHDSLKLQVVKTCKTDIERIVFKTAHYISLEANNFIPCHMSRWVTKRPKRKKRAVETGVSKKSKTDKAHLLPTIKSEANGVSDEMLDRTDEVDNQLCQVAGATMYQPGAFVEYLSEYNDYPKKIPLKKTEVNKARNLKSEPSPETSNNKKPRSVRVTDLTVFHKNLKDNRDDSKLRQTRIEDFFRPRRLMEAEKVKQN